MQAIWSAGNAHILEAYRSCVHPWIGPAASDIPDWATGKFRLKEVRVGDRLGNVADYHRDGSVTHSPAGVSSPSHHNLDFSALDFTAEQGKGLRKVGDYDNQAICLLQSVIDIVPNATDVLPGQTVTLTSHVARDAGAVHFPFAATYQKDEDGNVELLSVNKGDGGGELVTQVTALRTAEYWTWFFGVEHRRVTLEGTSPHKRVRVIGP